MSTINVDIVSPETGTDVVVSGVRITGKSYGGPIVPGYGDIAIGHDVMLSSTAGNNTAVGDSAMTNVTIGGGNCAFGAGALGGVVAGQNNIGIGVTTGQCVVGNENIFIGWQSGFGDFANPIASQNVAIGAMSGFNMSGSSNNTFLGWNAGFNTTTGNNNIVIGAGSDAATAIASNTITLGNALITTLRCAVTSITSLSDARDKEDIKDLSTGLDFVKTLRPVEFTWKDRDENGKQGIADFGFIAQDLKKSQEDAEKAEVLKLVYEENPEKLEASYGKLIPILVKAIQELSEEVKQLKN